MPPRILTEEQMERLKQGDWSVMEPPPMEQLWAGQWTYHGKMTQGRGDYIAVYAEHHKEMVAADESVEERFTSVQLFEILRIVPHVEIPDSMYTEGAPRPPDLLPPWAESAAKMICDAINGITFAAVRLGVKPGELAAALANTDLLALMLKVNPGNNVDDIARMVVKARTVYGGD